MPFTFAHPAIILPCHKLSARYVSMTGLIIGSLTPDFEYFLRMKMKGDYGHTLAGVLWLDLPLGIVLCLLFHQVIKRPIIDNSPKFIQKRFIPLRDYDWLAFFKTHWHIVCLSLLIGAYSHLFWDSFTHHSGFFSHYLGLHRQVFGLPMYKILQHSSTLIGAFIILLYVYKMASYQVTTTQPTIKYWLKISLLACITLGIRFMFGLKIIAYGSVIVSIVSSLLLAILVVSLLWREKNYGEERAVK